MFKNLGYPFDGGLKTQVRDFKETLNLNDVLLKEINKIRSRSSMDRIVVS